MRNLQKRCYIIYRIEFEMWSIFAAWFLLHVLFHPIKYVWPPPSHNWGKGQLVPISNKIMRCTMDLYIENKITNGSCVVRKRKRNNRSSSDEENSIANVVHFTATVSKVCIDIEKSIMQYILLQASGFDATD